MGVPPALERLEKEEGLKPYIAPAKVEYEKGTKASQQGCFDQAIVHFKNVESLLLKAHAYVATLIFPSRSEMDRVKAIQRDLQKLLEHVLELLQAIYQRPAGGGVPIKWKGPESIISILAKPLAETESREGKGDSDDTYSPLDIGIPNININQKGGGGGGGGGGGKEIGGGGNGGDGSKQMVNVYNLFSNGIDV